MKLTYTNRKYLAKANIIKYFFTKIICIATYFQGLGLENRVAQGRQMFKFGLPRDSPCRTVPDLTNAHC